MSTKDQIVRATYAHRDDIVSLLQQLVRTPSVAAPPVGEERSCQQIHWMTPWATWVLQENF